MGKGGAKEGIDIGGDSGDNELMVPPVLAPRNEKVPDIVLKSRMPPSNHMYEEFAAQAEAYRDMLARRARDDAAANCPDVASGEPQPETRSGAPPTSLQGWLVWLARGGASPGR